MSRSSDSRNPARRQKRNEPQRSAQQKPVDALAQRALAMAEKADSETPTRPAEEPECEERQSCENCRRRGTLRREQSNGLIIVTCTACSHRRSISSGKGDVKSSLRAAKTPDEIVGALARYLWARDHDGAKLPPEKVPSFRDLLEWEEPFSPPTDAVEIRRIPFLKDLGAERFKCRVYEAVLEALMRSGDDEDAKMAAVADAGRRVLERPRIPSVEDLLLVMHEGDVEENRDPGSYLLAPDVTAYLNRLPKIGPDTRENAIMPNPVALVRDLRSEQGELFDDLQLARRRGLQPIPPQRSLFATLPGFESGPIVKVPCLPLILFDASFRVSNARGKGAPLVLRLWVEAILSVPAKDRTRTVRLTVKPRDLIRALWPNGTFRPGRDGPKLTCALAMLHAARVPWIDSKGQPGGYWAIVAVRNAPDFRNPESELVLDVELPPGSQFGPLVHRPTLRKYGVKSAAAYRLSLGAAYYWNRYLTHKGKRLPPTVPVVERDERGIVLNAHGDPVTAKGGAPVTHWNDKRAIRTGEYIRNPELQRLPWLEASDLLALGAPEADTRNPATRRDTLRRVRKAISEMAAEGDLVEIKKGRRVRIEPPDWWGDPRGGQ